jgi:O-antigen ligase
VTRAAPRLPGGLLGANLLPLVFVAVAAAVGALFAYTAFRNDVLALPALIAFGALVVATAQRPEIGVAAAYVMVPLGNVQFYGVTPWWPVTAWAAFLLVTCGWYAFARVNSLPSVPVLAVPLAVYVMATVFAFGVAAGAESARAPLRSLVTGVLLFAATVFSIRDRRQLPWILAGIAGGALLAGLYALYQSVTGFSASEGFVTESGAVVHRVTAGFAHPNALGGFLVQLVPFVLAGLLLSRRTRPYYAVALAFALIGLYLSFSRSAIVALLLVPFFFVGGRRMLMLAPLIAVLLLFATPGLSRERFATLTQSGAEFATRSEIWRTAGSLWSEHPVVGVGLGQFPDAYSKSRVPGKEFLPNTALQPPPHAHNLFLQSLSEQGIIGTIALLAVLAAAIRTALRLRRLEDPTLSLIGSAGLASLTAFLIHNQFDVTPLEGTGIYFFGLLGLLSAATGIAKGGEIGEDSRNRARH